MPESRAVCTATGEWDTTTLSNDGIEVSALLLRISIDAGETDEFDNVISGGIDYQSEVTAYVTEVSSPQSPVPLFPTSIDIVTAQGTLTIVNNSPGGVDAPDATQVFYQGSATQGKLFDVTNALVYLLVNIDYNKNLQEVRLSLYRHHSLLAFWGSDEILEITML